MAITYSKAGRPCFVADIDFSETKVLALRDEFYDLAATFGYRDIMALSRALGVTPFTVTRWKYKYTFPRKDVAQQVIDWGKAGKPMTRHRPFPESPVI